MNQNKKPAQPRPRPVRVEIVRGTITIIKERLLIVEPVHYS